MHQVQLSDQLYQQAQRRAAEAGFASVDEYVADVLSDDLQHDDLDHLFTAERLAQLDGISASIKAGAKTYTAQDVQIHFDSK